MFCVVRMVITIVVNDVFGMPTLECMTVVRSFTVITNFYPNYYK
jgi:hypothetical protein